MEEEPPKCWLGCCNVRSYTLSLSIINIVGYLMLIIRKIVSIFESPGSTSFSIIFCMIFLYLNVKLRKGVLENDIAPIRHWLWVHLVMFFCSIFLMIVCVILISVLKSDYAKTEKTIETLMLTLIFITLEVGFMIPFYYPVYKFYTFEKTRLQQTGTSSKLRPLV